MLRDATDCALYREEVEDNSLTLHADLAIKKRAFDRLKWKCQWLRHEKRMKRICDLRMRNFHLIRLFNAIRNNAYASKREKLTVAYNKQCEIEEELLLSGRFTLNRDRTREINIIFEIEAC